MRTDINDTTENTKFGIVADIVFAEKQAVGAATLYARGNGYGQPLQRFPEQRLHTSQ